MLQGTLVCNFHLNPELLDEDQVGYFFKTTDYELFKWLILILISIETFKEIMHAFLFGFN